MGRSTLTTTPDGHTLRVADSDEAAQAGRATLGAARWLTTD